MSTVASYAHIHRLFVSHALEELACSVAAGVDVAITGDRDLQALATFEGIPIVNPAQYLVRVEGGTRHGRD